jgi:hypothetical protein
MTDTRRVFWSNSAGWKPTQSLVWKLVCFATEKRA